MKARWFIAAILVHGFIGILIWAFGNQYSISWSRVNFSLHTKLRTAEGACEVIQTSAEEGAFRGWIDGHRWDLHYSLSRDSSFPEGEAIRGRRFVYSITTNDEAWNEWITSINGPGALIVVSADSPASSLWRVIDALNRHKVRYLLSVPIVLGNAEESVISVEELLFR